MSQKMRKMSLCITNENNEVIYQNDSCNPDIVYHSFGLFPDSGNHFEIDIVEVDMNSNIS